MLQIIIAFYAYYKLETFDMKFPTVEAHGSTCNVQIPMVLTKKFQK